MPEINPYETPQSSAKLKANPVQSPAVGKKKIPLSIKTLLGLQIVAGLSTYIFLGVAGTGS